MSTVRHRLVPASSPPLDSIRQLSTALNQAKESASARGVTEDQFSQCLTSLAQTKLNSLRPKEKQKLKSKPRTCRSRLYLCFKVTWILWLLFLAICSVIMVYHPAGFLVHKIVHRHMYSITRPLRLTFASMLPYMKAIGLDPFSSDCLIQNPLLSDAQSCPCMYVKQSIELQLNETHRAMPEGILTVPNHNVYVLRNAVRGLEDFSLDAFQYYQDGPNPNLCFEMLEDSGVGVQVITDLFNDTLIDEYLELKTPWSYSWQECPDEENPLSYQSLLPEQEWLPDSVTPSNFSYFTLSSKWAHSSHHSDAHHSERFVAMLVVLGELRVEMNPSNQRCHDNCLSFRRHPILSAGDILVFDQTYWGFMTITWSRAALTSTTALTTTSTS